MPARFRNQPKPLRVARGQIRIPSSVMFLVRRLRVGCVRIRMRTVSRCRQIRPAGSYLRISFSFRRSSNKRMQASSHDSFLRLNAFARARRMRILTIGRRRSAQTTSAPTVPSRRTLQCCGRLRSEMLCCSAHNTRYCVGPKACLTGNPRL